MALQKDAFGTRPWDRLENSAHQIRKLDMPALLLFETTGKAFESQNAALRRRYPRLLCQLDEIRRDVHP